MEEYQLRVVDERNELGLKLEALDQFLNSENINRVSVVQKRLLKDQYEAMENYYRALDYRIVDFEFHIMKNKTEDVIN